MSTIAPERPDVSSQQTSPVDDRPPLRLTRSRYLVSGIAAFLASSAAAWMAGGLFRSPYARLVGIVGVLIGVGVVMASYVSRRPAVVQYLVVPIATLAGIALVLPDASGGNSNLVGLIGEAITAGGLKQPPIPFDPGWRFILVVVFALVGAASASTATGFTRAKLAVLVPVPVMMATALVQPRSSEIISTTVAIALMFAAQSLTYGNELADAGASTATFEVRRLARGGAMLVLLVVAVVGISRADFLFPDTAKDQIIPPQRPKAQPLSVDRILFTAISARPGPWRLGVLDTFDGRGWLMPAFDSGRLVTISGAAPIPVEGINTDAGRQKTTFEVEDIGGHVMPSLANPLSLKGARTPIDYDPVTQVLRLNERRAFRGLTYTIESPVPPGGNVLAEAPAPPESMSVFTSAPPAPNEVVVLLNEAPENLWERLQFVRGRFYEKVVAAGAGSPRDVPPARVVELLKGTEGSPFEITAAEALLARWAGVPSRIGYGYYSGERKAADRFEVHPKHGATWIEVYFQGHGWIPIVGVPPRARASLDDAKQNQDPNVLPTDELALVVFVPVRLSSVRLIYVAVRYWLSLVVPIAIGLALIWWLVPFVAKSARRYVRKRWAHRRGVQERVAVAYAEFRDGCSDLNIGRSIDTPLDFCTRVQNDDEHQELAWLVTRALWGDLRRDLRPSDADNAEELSGSVSRRIRVAQPSITRLLSIGSRTSLRSPYSHEIPNLWPAWSGKRALRRRVGKVLRTNLRRIRRLLPTQLMIIALLGGCGSSATTTRDGLLPDRLAPSELLGYELRHEPDADKAFGKAGGDSLVNVGRVFTIRHEDTIEGSIQIASFRREARDREREVREGLLRSIGTGHFGVTRLGQERVWVLKSSEQKMLLWFAPGGSYYQLMVTRSAFESADQLFEQLLRFRHGTRGSTSPMADYDPRRGGEE